MYFFFDKLVQERVFHQKFFTFCQSLFCRSSETRFFFRNIGFLLNFFSTTVVTRVKIHKHARACWFSIDCCYNFLFFIATCVLRNGILPSWQVWIIKTYCQKGKLPFLDTQKVAIKNKIFYNILSLKNYYTLYNFKFYKQI